MAPDEHAAIDFTSRGLDELIRAFQAPATPTPPRELASPDHYQMWLAAMARQQPNTSAGFPARPTLCTLADYLRIAMRSRSAVYIWTNEVIVNDIHYPTPMWVKALIAFETADVRGRAPRPETYRMAHHRLRDALATLQDTRDPFDALDAPGE